MLPNAHNGPRCLEEAFGGLFVPLAVPPNLRVPVVRIDPVSPVTVLRAAVPKASVYEDSNPGGDEDEICLSPDIGNGTHVDAIAMAPRVQRPPDSHFGFRVTDSLRLHPTAYLSA